MAMPILGGLFKGKSTKDCIDIYRRIAKDIKGPVFGLGFEDQRLSVKYIEKMGKAEESGDHFIAGMFG